MTQQLQELAQSDRPWAAKRAAYALQIIEGVNSGQVSFEEGQELMKDLVRADHLDAEADDLALRTALVTAVYVAAKIGSSAI